MRSFFTIATLAALATAGAARDLATHLRQPAQQVNGTHYVDTSTHETYKHFDCDVHLGQATDHFRQTIKGLHRTHKKPSYKGTPAARLFKKQTAPITVNTYFHVITSTAKADTITQDMATAQAAALNVAYNPIGITFNLVATDFTVNDLWAVAAGADMDALKASLRKGTYQDLNLYFHTDLANSILGTCTLPNTVPAGADPSIYVSDGCNVQAGTMPGGTIGGYNQGMTAVHETGHWLGLLHTFEGYACEGNGDFIDDTPFESVSTDGCPAKPAKDSCPTVTGVDPIHNYMDYSTDACYEGFTPLQVARIQSMWTQYRQGF